MNGPRKLDQYFELDDISKLITNIRNFSLEDVRVLTLIHKTQSPHLQDMMHQLLLLEVNRELKFRIETGPEVKDETLDINSVL